MNRLPANVLNAIMDLNGLTEHHYGIGPLEDSYLGDKRMIKNALNLASDYYSEDVDDLRAILLQ